jgi:tetratricopeptide (TPR) repeat protein
MKCRTKTILLLVVLIPTPLAACLWDSDTLAERRMLEEEREQFSTVVLNLITGKFRRHSPAMYEWRIADRKKRLIEEPENVALYDDLAVAYEKTGQTDLAIETILKKDKIRPGLYETHANLGTFYIHAGRLKEGLKEIEKAIEINPAAHFGREIYQRLLVEYVVTKTTDGKLQLPMSSDSNVGATYGFGSYVVESRLRGASWTIDEFREESEKAIEGILGMMRFGNYDSPVLLEALSDLLVMRFDQTQATRSNLWMIGKTQTKQLAARALLQASYMSTAPKQKSEYRQKAENVLSTQAPADETSGRKLIPIEFETQFLAELDAGMAWYENIVRQEELWISYQPDPEIESARRVSNKPSRSEREAIVVREKPTLLPILGKVGLALAGLGCLGMLYSIRVSRRVPVANDDSSGFT